MFLLEVDLSVGEGRRGTCLWFCPLRDELAQALPQLVPLLEDAFILGPGVHYLGAFEGPFAGFRHAPRA